MTFSKSLLAFALVTSLANPLSQACSDEPVATSESWDDLWVAGAKPTKGEAYLPDGLKNSDFDLTDDSDEPVLVGADEPTRSSQDVAELATPTEQATGEASESSRGPASVKKKGAAKNAGRTSAKNSKQQSANASKSSLPHVTLSKKPAPSKLAQQEMQETSQASLADSKSQWPSTASEGFEFKVRHKTQLSSMWVMKREGRYDLVFATNGGSRVNLTIPADQFYALKTAASQLRSPASDMSKCRDSFVQINVMSSGAQENKVASCLTAKGKDADKLRLLGATLSGYVR